MKTGLNMLEHREYGWLLHVLQGQMQACLAGISQHKMHQKCCFGFGWVMAIFSGAFIHNTLSKGWESVMFSLEGSACMANGTGRVARKKFASSKIFYMTRMWTNDVNELVHSAGLDADRELAAHKLLYLPTRNC